MTCPRPSRPGVKRSHMREKRTRDPMAGRFFGELRPGGSRRKRRYQVHQGHALRGVDAGGTCGSGMPMPRPDPGRGTRVGSRGSEKFDLPAWVQVLDVREVVGAPGDQPAQGYSPQHERTGDCGERSRTSTDAQCGRPLTRSWVRSRGRQLAKGRWTCRVSGSSEDERWSQDTVSLDNRVGDDGDTSWGHVADSEHVARGGFVMGRRCAAGA